jgi:GT2 family glycosyltransferase
MKLSIVIVNYNVRYFLEQCLHSVMGACKGMKCEIFVVDNNSVDGSVAMVREKFPAANLIANKENVGFSTANNQAIRQARGEYILLLNPDTLVEDDTLQKVVEFMDNHPEAGGLGVKMLDGKGKFLPESKRGLPTPAVAFFKVFGLAALFPKSKLFGRYHLGFLDRGKIHDVDVLSGAFMLLRHEALNKTGLLDEGFFMYGEDIDLSYRITKAGYKNYYFPDTRIIHYKGESTKKSSLNYVFLFYNAMIIFARKHFSRENARAFVLMINLAIYFRAFITITNQFLKKIFLPLVDTGLLFAGIILIKNYWERHFIYPDGGHYPDTFLYVSVPIYLSIWLFCNYITGVYDKPVRLLPIVQGITTGTVLILVVYSLQNKDYHFSRAIIILGALWGITVMMALRWLLHLLNFKDFKLYAHKNKRFVIIGEKEETERVAKLLGQTGMNPSFIGKVSYKPANGQNDGSLGNLAQIKEIINIHKINELIFCAKDIPAQVIIDQMSELKNAQVDYKIAPPESLSIIGSNSINTSGDLYIIEINAIVKRHNRRNKRLLDLSVAISLILLIPFALPFVRRKGGLIKNIFLVLIAKKSWVGFTPHSTSEPHKLPEIKKGVLTPLDGFRGKVISPETTTRLDMLYARDYKPGNDLMIILKGFYNLGNP